MTARRMRSWLMLLSRIVLFAGFQALFALGYRLAGRAGAWESSAAWWPFTVIATNVICIVLLIVLLRAEGRSYLDLFRFERKHARQDLLVVLGFLVIGGPLAYLPTVAIGRALFGDETTASNMMFQHLPLAAAWAGCILFPISQGLAELPTYFGYVMPRLKSFTGSAMAVVATSLVLSLQHVAVPLLFDTRFVVYRATMFLPFAFLVGILLNWRPRLLVYLAIIHVLINFSASVFLLSA